MLRHCVFGSAGLVCIGRCNGPFEAFTDGDAMLQPYGMRLRRAGLAAKQDGRYVVWIASRLHFAAGVIDGGVLTVYDGGSKQEILFSTATNM